MIRRCVLVTGATGFIGSNVVGALLADDSYKIVAIVRSMQNRRIAEYTGNPSVSFVLGSFFDSNLLEEIFSKYDVGYVIHLAAVRGAGTGAEADYREVNVHGSEVLLKASLENGIERFIYCSSVGVYGTIPCELPANLKTPLLGDNEYHRSKLLAEELVASYRNLGLNTYIVRPTITYGRGDNGFPNTLVRLVRRRLLLLPTRDPLIHLLHVRSLSMLFVEMIKSEDLNGEIFIAADKKPVSLLELVDAIHRCYYQSNYPRCLRLPNFVFGAIFQMFRLMKKEKWSTRFQLISRSWSYDIGETMRQVNFEAADTMETFVPDVCE